ncbi:molybdopterin-dependent oxidoreductase [Desulforegula conservatrix]|uniref:molybdopterin-dependent oxidoreductase n=1 Tax=Desulforegula conservatrix TaxID=153026 RepID=UPI00041A895C|nr:molybdopterin-dependent oxidoreductase [Desulforegula conservatrix]
MTTRTAFRVCPFCEAGCGLEITLTGNEVTRVRGDKDHVMSKGFCCPKGIAIKELHEDPDRLRHPVIKENGAFRKATWEEAFKKISEGFDSVRKSHGNDAIAIYLGNPNTHTMAGALFLKPLIKALKTRNFFTASTVDQIPKQTACGFLYGSNELIPVPDIDHTALFVIFGGNPLVSGGSLMTAPDMPGRIKKLKERGGKLVVIDPMKTRTAEAADIHHFIRPGTDVALLFAIVRILIKDFGLPRHSYDDRLKNLDKLRDYSEIFTVELASKICGIPEEAIKNLAKDISETEKSTVYGRMGTSTVRYGTISSWLIEIINILTGNLDRQGGTMFPKPAHIPEKARSKKGFVTGRWKSRVSGAPEVGGEIPVSVMAEEMETPGQGQIRALVTVAGNPVVAIPESERVDRAIAGLDFMVSVDFYINETTRHADVILPPASPLSHGHYDFVFHGFAVRNGAVYSPPVIEKNDDERDKWEILARLALIADGKGLETEASDLGESMVNELAHATIKAIGGEVSGVTREMLTGQLTGKTVPERILDFLLKIGPYGDGFGMKPGRLSLQKLLESPHGIDLGALTSRLGSVISTPDRKIDLLPEVLENEIKNLCKWASLNEKSESDMLLIGRRHIRTNNSWFHNLPSMTKGNSCSLIVNPTDASRLGLSDKGKAEIKSDKGIITVPVSVSDRIMPGVVSLPHGWGHDMEGARLSNAEKNPGVNTNRITPNRFDPLCGNAVLNGIPVKVRALRY